MGLNPAGLRGARARRCRVHRLAHRPRPLSRARRRGLRPARHRLHLAYHGLRPATLLYGYGYSYSYSAASYSYGASHGTAYVRPGTREKYTPSTTSPRAASSHAGPTPTTRGGQLWFGGLAEHDTTATPAHTYEAAPSCATLRCSTRPRSRWASTWSASLLPQHLPRGARRGRAVRSAGCPRARRPPAAGSSTTSSRPETLCSTLSLARRRRATTRSRGRLIAGLAMPVPQVGSAPQPKPAPNAPLHRHICAWWRDGVGSRRHIALQLARGVRRGHRGGKLRAVRHRFTGHAAAHRRHAGEGRRPEDRSNSAATRTWSFRLPSIDQRSASCHATVFVMRHPIIQTDWKKSQDEPALSSSE